MGVPKRERERRYYFPILLETGDSVPGMGGVKILWYIKMVFEEMKDKVM